MKSKSDSSRFYLLHSVSCLKEWTFVRWTWMFLKLSLSMFHWLLLSLPCHSVWPLNLNWTLTFSVRLYNYCSLYKMKLFILDANTCTEFMEFYCCPLVVQSPFFFFVYCNDDLPFSCPFKNQFLLAFVKGNCITTVWWGKIMKLTIFFYKYRDCLFLFYFRRFEEI